MLMTLASLLSFSFPDKDDSSFGLLHLDKIVHFIFYFITAVLGTLFLREITKGRNPMVPSIIKATIFAIIYGIVIEVLQEIGTTERSGDVLDAVANTLGAIAGAFFVKYFFSGKRQLKWRL